MRYASQPERRHQLPVRSLRAGLVVILLTTTRVAAQTPPPGVASGGSGSALVSLDFTATAIGDFPANLTMIDGVMEVVNMNGRHMLRASAPSAFLVRLPQVLPTDFTVEVDLVPKVFGNENDFGLEGTPTINQGTASAYLLWQSEYLRVIGGDVNNFEAKVPDALAVSTQGVLTRVTVVVQGTTMKVYTNGRLLSTLSNRRFVRGPVLRVFLGGQDDGSYAVHLAGLRVIGSAAPANVVAGSGNPTPSTAPTGAPNAPTSTSPAPPSSAPTSSGTGPGSTSISGAPGSSTTSSTTPTTSSTAVSANTLANPGGTTGSTTAPASGRYRVTMTGVQVAKPTADDPLDRDGKADEIFGNAIVVRWDRQGQRPLGTTIVKSREYGDVGNGQTWPYRIRAGTGLPSGGLTVGNVAPIGFIPSAPPILPKPDEFPFTLWEGTLMDGGEAVVLFPSVWERDIDDVAYKNYTGNWVNNTAPVLQSQVLMNQYASPALMVTMGPTDIGTFGQAAAGTTFTQPNYGVYAWPAMSLMAPVDRMIGMMTVGGALAYPERILVITREKLANLQVGGYTDLQIPLIENALGTDGIYTMYLRVERLN